MSIPEFNRKCGACSVCCTHLGINALSKPGGTPCTHLTRKLGATRQCNIYTSRPEACSHFVCAWIEGLGDDITDRPDRNGLLIVAYKLPDGGLSATITIVDPRRCGSIEDNDSKIMKAVQNLWQIGFDDIKVISRPVQKVIYFKNGTIHAGDLLPGTTHEDLKFAVYDPPIGTYREAEKLEEKAKEEPKS